MTRSRVSATPRGVPGWQATCGTYAEAGSTSFGSVTGALSPFGFDGNATGVDDAAVDVVPLMTVSVVAVAGAGSPALFGPVDRPDLLVVDDVHDAQPSVTKGFTSSVSSVMTAKTRGVPSRSVT